MTKGEADGDGGEAAVIVGTENGMAVSYKIAMMGLLDAQQRLALCLRIRPR